MKLLSTPPADGQTRIALAGLDPFAAPVVGGAEPFTARERLEERLLGSVRQHASAEKLAAVGDVFHWLMVFEIGAPAHAALSALLEALQAEAQHTPGFDRYQFSWGVYDTAEMVFRGIGEKSDVVKRPQDLEEVLYHGTVLEQQYWRAAASGLAEALVRGTAR